MVHINFFSWLKSFFFKTEEEQPIYNFNLYDETPEDETLTGSQLDFELWSWFSDRVAEGVLTYDHFEDFEDIFGGECFCSYTLDEFLTEFHV